jgi:hypothetical protein
MMLPELSLAGHAQLASFDTVAAALHFRQWPECIVRLPPTRPCTSLVRNPHSALSASLFHITPSHCILLSRSCKRRPRSCKRRPRSMIGIAGHYAYSLRHGCCVSALRIGRASHVDAPTLDYRVNPRSRMCAGSCLWGTLRG